MNDPTSPGSGKSWLQAETPLAAEALASRPVSTGRLRPGAQLGCYCVGERLGEGATGNVYAATRLDDGLPVALKVLHPHLVGDRQVSQRFHREVMILRRLHGRHIVGIHDAGEDPSGLLYMVLERVVGTPLDLLLKEHRELSLGAVRAIMLAICQALQVAHEAGVIHRDLKPSNVVVQLEGEAVRHVHVLDFGLSKVLQGEGLSATNLTEQNMVLGTPEYMAPEQARGDEIDERCDIYAAGVILHELLVGSVPFPRRTLIAIMTAHMTEPPPCPQSRPSGARIPASLSAVVSHTLAKHRKERYPSAQSLAEALCASFERPEDPDSVHPPPADRDSFPFRPTDEFVVAPGAVRVAVSDAPQLAPPPISTFETVRPWLTVTLVAGLTGIVLGALFALRC